MTRKIINWFACPGPGARLAGFLLLYAAVVFTPVTAWQRFVLYFLLAALLIPRNGVKTKKLLLNLVRTLPMLAVLGAMLFIFGSLGVKKNVLVIINLAVKTFSAVVMAVMVWSGDGYQQLLLALQQIRAPGMLISLVSLALSYLNLFFREAGIVSQARKARSGPNLTLRRKIRLLIPMISHFSFLVLEKQGHIYAAMVARGYCGGALAMPVQRNMKKDLPFLLFFILAVILVNTI